MSSQIGPGRVNGPRARRSEPPDMRALALSVAEHSLAREYQTVLGRLPLPTSDLVPSARPGKARSCPVIWIASECFETIASGFSSPSPTPAAVHSRGHTGGVPALGDQHCGERGTGLDDQGNRRGQGERSAMYRRPNLVSTSGTEYRFYPRTSRSSLPSRALLHDSSLFACVVSADGPGLLVQEGCAGFCSCVSTHPSPNPSCTGKLSPQYLASVSRGSRSKNCVLSPDRSTHRAVKRP